MYMGSMDHSGDGFTHRHVSQYSAKALRRGTNDRVTNGRTDAWAIYDLVLTLWIFCRLLLFSFREEVE